MIHRVIGSLTQWLTDSLSHRLTNSPIHWPTDYWLIHSSLHDLSKFTHSLIHWIMVSWIDALVHWIFVSLIHWFIDSLTSHALTHGFIVSLVHSVSCAWILSCHFSGISTAIWLFVDAHHFLIYSQFIFFDTSALAWGGHYLVILSTYLVALFPLIISGLLGATLIVKIVGWSHAPTRPPF